MTLDELAKETLTQKHRRMMQAKCRHKEIYSSTTVGPDGTFTNAVCFDCGKLLSPARINRCEECGKNRADPPGRLCVGCEAYRDHTGHF